MFEAFNRRTFLNGLKDSQILMVAAKNKRIRASFLTFMPFSATSNIKNIVGRQQMMYSKFQNAMQMYEVMAERRWESQID